MDDLLEALFKGFFHLFFSSAKAAVISTSVLVLIGIAIYAWVRVQ